MRQRLKAGVTLLAFALMAALSFHGARLWQSMQASYLRVAPPADCDLHAGPCGGAAGGGHVRLSITPRTIPLMQPLRLLVETEGLAARAVAVEIRGLNMDMGLNRTPLVQTAEGRWEGETILPVCSQRRMQWEAAVRLDTREPVEVPFVFHTTRP